VERLLVVRCPDLLEFDDAGTRLRCFARVHDAVGTFCPWVSVIRPGICCLPARGPARVFGGEEQMAERIRLAVSVVEGAGPVEVGIADGLFAADLAAQAGIVVAAGETPAFLADWPLSVLRRPDLDHLLRRLGIDTLGALAALPERHVLGRLGKDGVVCHQVASGRSGELPEQRQPDAERMLAALAAPETPSTQEDFWAGHQDARQAARVLAKVQTLLGPDAVQVVRARPGRGAEEGFDFVTWSPVDALVPSRPSAPWPGRPPSPAPAVVYRDVFPAELDGKGKAVTVSGRGELSAPPERLSVAGDRWTPVLGSAGPWPAWERWWRPSRQRTAHLQVMTTGRAHLLRTDRGAWRLVATYD
jgi:hypothetical protein